MTLRVVAAGLCLIPIVLSSCNRGAAPAGSVRRDSAGIAIVDNTDWRDTINSRRMVDGAPVLSIGAEDGPDDYRFAGISGVVRLSTGEIIIADRSNTLRFYKPDGTYRRTVGREGDGPGEFRTISLLRQFRGDSLIIWDFGLRRATVLTPAGGVVRVAGGPGLPGFVFPVDVFDDGSVLLQVDGGVDLRRAQPGMIRSETRFVRFDTRSRDLDTVATLIVGSSVVPRSDVTSVVSLPFAPQPVAAAFGALAYIGGGGEFEIRTIGERGRLLRILRLRRRNAPLTRELKEALLDRLTRRAPTTADRARIAAQFTDLPYPASLPAYETLVVDDGGRLWVGAYQSDHGSAHQWTVFDTAGRMVYRATTPAGFAVMGIGPAEILGIAEDSVGVERVELLRLGPIR